MDLKEQLQDNVFTDIIGQNETKEQLKSALLMSHHMIIVGTPGIGKTTLAKNVAELLPTLELSECAYHCHPDDPVCPFCKQGENKTKKVPGRDRFVRIQGSPDLSVEDLIGDIDPIKALQFGPMSIEAFTPGKIFKANNGVLFFDELNRCPEKLQNALLQILEEGIATVGGYDIDFPANFIFIGTMNPEDSSTEKISDVFLDRVDLIYMTHPESLQFEQEIIQKKGNILDVRFPEELQSTMLRFIRQFRSSDKLEKVPSVRASLSLYERSQANAYLAGSDTVRFKDIERAIVSVLSHRITMKPSVKYLQDPVDFVKKELNDFMQKEKISSEGDDP
ncbi:MAG: ATP-binding protein [Candidatus Woesearchaeota archaeon]